MTEGPRDIKSDEVDQVDAIERLAIFCRLMEHGLVYGDAAERALAAAALEHIDRAEGGLDAALGLDGPGWTGALRRYRQARRDEMLLSLWRACWPEQATANAAAVKIAAAWRRYAASRWPRDRRAGVAPPVDPEATLHRLLDRGHEPLSHRRIREILSRSGWGETGDLQPMEIAKSRSQINIQDGE